MSPLMHSIKGQLAFHVAQQEYVEFPWVDLCILKMLYTSEGAVGGSQ